MPTETYNLAIETSSPIDSIAIGRGDEFIESLQLPDRSPGRAPSRSSNLVPAIAELFDRRKIDRRELAEIYVSVGPGSFTGLRIAIAAAQMLAKVLGAKTVAVPTIDVVAQNAPATHTPLTVCLNQKRDTVYAATYEYISKSSNEFNNEGWHATSPAKVCSIADLLTDVPRPQQLLSQTKLDLGDADLTDIEVLPIDTAIPKAETVWRLGRTLARDGAYTAPSQLLPIYARIPEAVELWNKRHA